MPIGRDLGARILTSSFSFKLTGGTAHLDSLGVLSPGSHYPTAAEISLVLFCCLGTQSTETIDRNT